MVYTSSEGKDYELFTKQWGSDILNTYLNNDFIRRERVNVGNINSDGSFELDVPVAYPQFDYFEALAIFIKTCF